MCILCTKKDLPRIRISILFDVITSAVNDNNRKMRQIPNQLQSLAVFTKKKSVSCVSQPHVDTAFRAPAPSNAAAFPRTCTQPPSILTTIDMCERLIPNQLRKKNIVCILYCTCIIIIIIIKIILHARLRMHMCTGCIVRYTFVWHYVAATI